MGDTTVDVPKSPISKRTKKAMRRRKKTLFKKWKKNKKEEIFVFMFEWRYLESLVDLLVSIKGGGKVRWKYPFLPPINFPDSFRSIKHLNIRFWKTIWSKRSFIFILEHFEDELSELHMTIGSGTLPIPMPINTQERATATFIFAPRWSNMIIKTFKICL